MGLQPAGERESSMKDDKKGAGSAQPAQGAGSIPNRILGSLRDALNAASRDDRSGDITVGQRTDVAPKAAAEPAKAPATPAAHAAQASRDQPGAPRGSDRAGASR